MKVKILSPLKTERLGNRLWVLLEPFIFEIDGIKYTVPSGFVTDGASCPRILWSVCAPVAGPFGEGAVVHDWFYNEGPDIGRFNADMVLYVIGRYRNSNILRAQLVKSGVNICGKWSYKTGVDKVVPGACYNFEYAVGRVRELSAGPA